jgi:hypothetical protein
MRIPPEYADLALAFSKKKATQLPPYQQGNCAIDLLADAALPRSHVYPLSLHRDGGYGNIRLRIPASGVPSVLHFTRLLKFLFVKKKEEGLHRVLTIGV